MPHYGIPIVHLRQPNRQKIRTPDVALQFLPGGENGLSHSFRWRELGRWGRQCRLPARAEFGPAARIGSSEGEHRLPHLWAHCKFHDIRSSELAKFEEIATEFCKCLNGPAYFEVM